MQENGSQIENQNDDLTNTSSTDNEYSKWVDNQGDEVKNVFGFNSSAELVNGRAAMIGFLMLILTELVLAADQSLLQFLVSIKNGRKKI